MLHIAQDARVYAALLDDAPARHVLAAGRRGYVHVVSGVAQVGGYRLEAGDAAFVEGEAVTARSAVAGAVTELLLFYLRLASSVKRRTRHKARGAALTSALR